MISKFNDATEMQIQSAEIIGGLLQIKAINTTPETLRQKFSDEFACRKITIIEREQVVGEHENYTKLLRIEEYTGGIYGVAMEKAGETTAERLAEVETENAALKEALVNANTQITDLQGAICELYEMGGAEMIYIAKVYADLIRKEEKSIENVPESIREQVREILADQEG